VPALSKLPEDGGVQAERQRPQGLLNPFEPHTPEAEALRGAMSLLLMLIVFCDELIKAPAPGACTPGDDRGGIKRH